MDGDIKKTGLPVNPKKIKIGTSDNQSTKKTSGSDPPEEYKEGKRITPY